MTPKEKAVDLVIKMEHPFWRVSVFKSGASKALALIAVDEILEIDIPILEEEADAFYDYWQQVKQEIEKL